MDLSEYRNKQSEQMRISDLLNLVPISGKSALDVGASDGYISKLLTKSFKKVTALDLDKPDISHSQVHCVRGDITSLEFPDNYFDLVLCAEVLEHLPQGHLAKACSELARVVKSYVLIGVPYKQDIRVGRTTCSACGKTNPPWGHINVFDEERLKNLFAGLEVGKIAYVGRDDTRTNCISSFLRDLAGNPYGTYAEGEVCGHCGAKLTNPPARNALQKVFSKSAFYVDGIQKVLFSPTAHAHWIHILFLKPDGLRDISPVSQRHSDMAKHPESGCSAGYGSL